VARTSKGVARRAATLVGLVGIVATLSGGVASAATSSITTSTTTTTPTSSTTTTTAPATVPSAPRVTPGSDDSGLTAAEALLVVTQEATVTLDQLQERSARAQIAYFKASVALVTERAALRTTTGEVNHLKKVASRLSIDIYMSSTPAARVISTFATKQAAQMKALTIGVYDQVAANDVSAKIARLESLERSRATSAAQASATERLAAGASRDAARALASAKKTQAHLVSLLASVSPATLAALAQLEADGNASIEALLDSGKLHLAKGVADPPAVLPSAFTALEFAAAQIGKPYIWGGTGPVGYDCSGLVQQAWAAAGVALPRVAADQANATVPIAFSQLQPGDLVFFEQPVGHVGIYIGGGQMIDAPYTGAYVRIDSIFWSKLEGFGRVTASS
jgi:cell wall-associated NlpC family hydrolase